MHVYKWPINCTRTRTVRRKRTVATGDADDEEEYDVEEEASRAKSWALVTMGTQEDATNVRTMRAELIGHFQPCMTEIYLHIDARTADYMATYPYAGGEAGGEAASSAGYLRREQGWALQRPL